MISIQSGSFKRFVAMGFLVSMAGAHAATTAAPAKKGDTPLQRLNIAEQQEVLAERLSRSWAMKGIGSMRPRATTNFDEDSRRYVRQLKYLQTEADTPQLKDNYQQLELAWTKYMEATEASAAQLQARSGDAGNEVGAELPPTAFVSGTQNTGPTTAKAEAAMPAAVKTIYDQTEKLLAIAAKGSDLMRQRIGAEPTEGLRLAGVARTQAQRMSKLYFFRALGVTSSFITNDLKNAEANYLASIKRLRELSEDRPKSAGALSLVDQQWMFFSEILHNPVDRDERDAAYQMFAKTGDSLLIGLDDLCKSFEAPPPAP
jgi:hypothetical protein